MSAHRPRRFFGGGLWLILLSLINSCGSLSPRQSIEKAQRLAGQTGFVSWSIPAQQFSLQSFHRKLKAADSVRVYIEGDGRAWPSRSRAPANPTPSQHLVLQLALADTSHNNIFYLGRPCQWRAILADSCVPKYWQGARFSEAVVAAMNIALDQIKSKSHAKKIELIGFSGGASVAILLASRRADIVSIRSVAGNLSSRWLNRHHRLSPLRQSLPVAAVAKQIRHIPQLHFYGSNDAIVPHALGLHYLSGIEGRHCIEINHIVGPGHNQGWLELWPKLLTQSLPCTK